jgi:cytochrome c-type biogenesis protein CcmH/NrfG
MSKIANHVGTFAIFILILLGSSAFAATEPPELQHLRDQLKKAQEAEDKPAIIELSQRIVAIGPNDSNTWDTLAETQLESEELDGLERTLAAWQKAFKKPPQRSKIFGPHYVSSARITNVQRSIGLRSYAPSAARNSPSKELSWKA